MQLPLAGLSMPDYPVTKRGQTLDPLAAAALLCRLAE